MVDCPPKRGGDPFGNSVGSLGLAALRSLTIRSGIFDAGELCRLARAQDFWRPVFRRSVWRQLEATRVRLPVFSSHPSFETSGKLEIRESADQLLALAWNRVWIGLPILSMQHATQRQGPISAREGTTERLDSKRLAATCNSGAATHQTRD
jgi:hypothetical protein